MLQGEVSLLVGERFQLVQLSRDFLSVLAAAVSQTLC